MRAERHCIISPSSHQGGGQGCAQVLELRSPAVAAEAEGRSSAGRTQLWYPPAHRLRGPPLPPSGLTRSKMEETGTKCFKTNF